MEYSENPGREAYDTRHMKRGDIEIAGQEERFRARAAVYDPLY
jgi:hypothetical protein